MVCVTASSSVQFSSRWYLCTWKSPEVLHPVSQKIPQSCLWNGSNVQLIDNGLPFQGRSSSASSFYASLLQVIDGVMSSALCPQVVSHTSIAVMITIILKVFKQCKILSGETILSAYTGTVDWLLKVHPRRNRWKVVTADIYEETTVLTHANFCSFCLFVCLFSKDLCECLWQKHHKTAVLVVVCICSIWDGTTSVKNRNSLIQQQRTYFDGVWLTSGLIEDLCLPLWEGELFHVPVSPHHVAVRAGSEDTAGELAHWHHHHTSPLLKTPVCMEPLETIMAGLFVSLWHLAFNSSGRINQPNEQSRNITKI